MRILAATLSLGVVACHTSAPVLQAGLAGAATLAVDSTSMYWVENGPPTFPPSSAVPVLLRRAPLGGGTPETLASGIAASWDLRVVDGQLYFAGIVDRRIFSVPISGGTPRVVGAPAAGEQLFAWTVQGEDVFTITTDSAAYHLRRSPLAGGAPVELHSAAYYRDAYSGPQPPDQLAVTADAIFLVEKFVLDARLESRILRRPRGDDPALPLSDVHTALTIANLAADARDLFWTEESLQTFRQTVAALSLAGGAPRVLFELFDRGTLLLAAPDGSGHVLTLDSDSGSDFRAPRNTIRRVDSSGGGRELIDQEEPIEALASWDGHAWYISGSEIRLAF